jgi:hypothetical protein
LDPFEVSGREKRRAFVLAIVFAFVLSVIIGPGVANAINTVFSRIKDTGGGRIDAKAIPAQGLTDVPGSKGAVDTRNFPGGTGLLGIANCSAASGGPPSVTIPGGNVVSDLLLTGTDGTVAMTSAALPGYTFLKARVTADSPNVIADLASGLGVTAPLTFTATGTDCELVVLGSGPGA